MKKNLLFLVSFLSAKGVVFFAPLFLADILSKSDFGLLEYALAGLGMLLNSIISLGVTGAYPYFILKEKKLEIKEGFFIHPLWLILFFLSNNIGYFIFELYDIGIYMAANVSYIIAVQQFYSTIFKSDDKIKRAVFLDAGIYFILITLVVIYYFKLVIVNIKIINLILCFYGIILSLFGLAIFLKQKKDAILSKYNQILKFGFHILISSFFLFFFTVAGRLLTKYFFDYETTGLYGYYFRISAVVVLLYQVVSIRFFRDLYIRGAKVLDTYYSYFIIFIFILSMLIYCISPYILPVFSTYFKDTYPNNKLLFFIIFCQMTMWIASALNSSIVDREGLAKINNIYFLILFLISAVIFYYLRSSISLVNLAFILYTIHFLANLTQIFTLKQKNIRFTKMFYTLLSIYTLTCVSIFLIQS